MLMQRLKNVQHVLLLFRDPMVFASKLGAKISVFWDEFWLSSDAREMVAYNKKTWAGYAKSDSDKIILVEMHGIFTNVIACLSFANVLARKKGAVICSFGREKWPLRRVVHAIYRSFNARRHFDIMALSPEQKVRVRGIIADVRPGLKTAEDVFNLKVDQVHIGMDIYESYLKETSRPTVEIDAALDGMLEFAVSVLVFWSDFFRQHQVVAAIVSHDVYIDSNILCRIAYRDGVPAYLPNNFNVIRSCRPHTSTARFLSYRYWFDRLSKDEQALGLAKAKEQLTRRFKGELEGDMLHAPVSAFDPKNEGGRVLRQSDKPKVLICTHCFYDNPYSYGGMFFLDFREWLMFLKEIADQTDYDWYLKTHPAPLPGTHEIIREILGENSSITVIPSKSTPRQMIREGLQYVLTVYGSVGHEYPALGVQVVNAGYNPHVAYDFTWTPRNREEYRQWLLDLPSLKKNIDINELYEFYYMHYYYSSFDDCVYPSARQLAMSVGVKGLGSQKLFRYVLDHGDPAHHKKMISRFEAFIDSDMDYLFLKGPVSGKPGAVIASRVT
ncbi:MAG: hypothetical protein HQL17_08665 [Candidatus Omnitrophica bacterium]|nr:hypothetical protein [Candidatus Omnitrophota bacterium]